MKKRFTEEQIIGFLREAESGLPVAELCRRHGCRGQLLPMAPQVWRYERVGRQTPHGAGNGERATETAVGRCTA